MFYGRTLWNRQVNNQTNSRLSRKINVGRPCVKNNIIRISVVMTRTAIERCNYCVAISQAGRNAPTDGYNIMIIIYSNYFIGKKKKTIINYFYLYFYTPDDDSRRWRILYYTCNGVAFDTLPPFAMAWRHVESSSQSPLSVAVVVGSHYKACLLLLLL